MALDRKDSRGGIGRWICLRASCKDAGGGPGVASGMSGSQSAPPQDSPLSYRFATLQDVAAVVALTESAYRGEASRVGWTTEAELLDGRRTGADEVEEILTRSEIRILLAFDKDRLVASAKLERQEGATYFGMFAVDPQLQDRGYGRRVLAQAERVAQQEFGATRMAMEVIVQRKELIAWYERRGYRLTGERSEFPYGDARFGIPKRDDLYFVRLEKQLG